MAFQLHIRQNLDAATDHFARSKVREYTMTPVSIGSAESCDCRLSDPVFAPTHCRIESRTDRAGEWLVPMAAATVHLNGELVQEPCRLHSGGEIRVGHWTLIFQRVYASTRRNRRFELLSAVAKVLVGLILATEVLVVTWLPRRLHQTTFWRHDIVRQRLTSLLDQLRRENRKTTDSDPVLKALRPSINNDLNERAVYISEYGDTMSAQQNQDVFEELTAFSRLLEVAAQSKLLPNPPAVDIDAGVQALLQHNGEVKSTHE